MRPVYRSLVVAGLLLGGAALPSKGRAVSAFAGATELTQLSNFVQLIEHSVRFAKMVKQGIEMVKQAKAQVESFKQTLQQFDPKDFNSILGLVQGADDALNGFQSITFGARSSLDQFKKRHPGYVMPQDAKQAYRELDTETLEMTKRITEQMDVSIKDARSDLELAKKLHAKIQAGDGEVKQLQLVNEFLYLLNVQFAKLTSVLSADAAQMAAYEAREVQRETYQKQALSRFMGSPMEPTPPIDWSARLLKRYEQ